MFCPPGYVLIEDIFPRILDRSQAVSEVQGVAPDDEMGLYFRHSLNAMFALEMFLGSNPSLSVCSPDGVVLRVSRRILTRIQDRGVRPSHQYFECIDEQTWMVDVEPWGPPKAMDEGVDLVVEALLSRQRKRANSFSRFNGWTVTIKNEDLPEDDGRFDQYLNFGEAFDDRQCDSQEQKPDQKDGRPPKLFDALIAFCRRFPDGRKSTPVKVIQTAVIEQMGQNISETSLRRVFRLREVIDGVRASEAFDPTSCGAEEVATILDDPSEEIGSILASSLVAEAIRAGYPFK